MWVEVKDAAQCSTMYRTALSQQRVAMAQMSTVLRFSNPDLGQSNADHHGVTGSASKGLH